MNTVLHHIPIEGYALPVLHIRTATQNVISVPTGIGCVVGCTFCVSSQSNSQRRLMANEIVELVIQSATLDPFTLAFTGEGEVMLNARQVREAVEILNKMGLPIKDVRYSFSGIMSHRISLLPTHLYKSELRFSLHTCDPVKRGELIRTTDELDDIERNIKFRGHAFDKIAINYVLQEGINDSDQDIDALASWGDRDWTILLNPLMTESGVIMHPRMEEIRDYLIAHGRTVEMYQTVAKQLCNTSSYKNLVYKPI